MEAFEQRWKFHKRCRILVVFDVKRTRVDRTLDLIPCSFDFWVSLKHEEKSFLSFFIPKAFGSAASGEGINVSVYTIQQQSTKCCCIV